MSEESEESPFTNVSDMATIDELKLAFKAVEVSNPGISDQLLKCISAHLHHGYVNMYV